MTVPDDMRAHHLYCTAHLARLRLEAEAETERGVPLPPALAQQVTQVTRMILAEAEAEAEAEAGGRALMGTMADSRGATKAARFLAARLTRMAVAAHDAVAAAERGDAAALRRQLRRFDTLTSAMWTVQAALHPKPPHHIATAPSRRMPTRGPLPRSTRSHGPARAPSSRASGDSWPCDPATAGPTM
jgi:hypothetical protein